MRNGYKSLFTEQVSIAPLATFRVLFGLLMVIGAIRFMALGWIDEHYILPVFHFNYYGFEWVKPLPAFGMYAVHILMLCAALGVMLGAYYRLASIVLFITFTYTELIDLTYYLNHYYFVSLVCLLLIFLPAHRSFSWDVKRNPAMERTTVPAWCINIIKFQVTVVYVYAGLAKIRYDWLIEALPLKIWLPSKDNLWLIGGLFKLPVTAYLFSWIGMLYDTTIVLWLSWKKTRTLAFLSVVIFHVLTGLLFQIGVFPMVMIATVIIFFSDEWHLKYQQKWKKLWDKTVAIPVSSKAFQPKFPNIFILSILAIYMSFQLLFPWRFVLYPGNSLWTEQGYRFGWRVMLMEKSGYAAFYVKDSLTGREGEVINSDFLNVTQEKQMSMQPDMILQYAHFLHDHYEQQGVHNPQVRAEVYVTLNGRPSALFIDSTINLAAINDSWKHKDWILQYNPTK